MSACMCTAQCKACGACCQVGCAHRGLKLSDPADWRWPPAPLPLPASPPTPKSESTCPTCKGSGKVKPA